MREDDQQLLSRALAIARQSIPSCDWSTVADAIAADRRDWERHLRKPEDAVKRDLFPGLEPLRRDGFAVHPLRLDRDKVAAIRRHLEELPVINGYHPYAADPREPLLPLSEARQRCAFAGYTMDQLLRTPHIVDFVNDPAIVDFAEAALGCVPTLYSINAWWSFPASAPTGDGAQLFHRDNDDWRFITLFVYLTDVDDLSGPHQLIAGSHTLDGLLALLERAPSDAAREFDAAGSFSNNAYFGSQFSNKCENLFGKAVVNIAGPAGTAFMANTIAIHRGLTPKQEPRLVLWARYGFGPNTNSADLEQGPLARFQVKADLADTPRNRYINRLLFEFDRRAGLVPPAMNNVFASTITTAASGHPDSAAPGTAERRGVVRRLIRALRS